MTPTLDHADDPSWDTPFCKALRWRLHDPKEALSLAFWHTGRANEARRQIPQQPGGYAEQCRAAYLESCANNYDALAAACRRHADHLSTAEIAGSVERP